ncbi:helix-turn-helix domain-containing protein [Nonomuraea mesophila]|uniref:helix-turn-helix domain-containing protein n=1 Tax=Nonomuraea mesophila TaxID=2530382 RepID=UPI00319DB695
MRTGDALLAPAVTRRLVERFGRRDDAGPPAPHRDLPELTVRELEVLWLPATGLSNVELAERLTLSPATVKTHVTRILAKPGLRAPGSGPRAQGPGLRAPGSGPRAQGPGLRAPGSGLRAQGPGLRAQGTSARRRARPRDRAGLPRRDVTAQGVRTPVPAPRQEHRDHRIGPMRCHHPDGRRARRNGGLVVRVRERHPGVHRPRSAGGVTLAVPYRMECFQGPIRPNGRVSRGGASGR